MKIDPPFRACGRGAALLLCLALSGCALHWPWRHRAAPAAASVHEINIVNDASAASAPIAQYWDRNTLLLDLTGVGAQGGAKLTPIPGRGGWPARLEFRVKSGAFAHLEVLAAQRVVFSVPAQGPDSVLQLAPGVYLSDTDAITLNWSAAAD